MTRFLALLVVLAGCHGGATKPPRVHEGEGLSIVIHAGRDPSLPGRAHVDERRWLEVPAHGELELGAVANPIELESVVVESESEPGALTTRSCRVIGASGGLAETSWMWGRALTIVLRDGKRVDGEVVDVGDLMAVVEDEEANTSALVPVESMRVDREDDGAASRTPSPGDPVMATDRDGREILGTFVAEVPERLVVRGADGTMTNVPPEEIVRIAAAGVPSEYTLRCEVESRHPGRQLVRFSYSSVGWNWRASHRVRDLRVADSIQLETMYSIDAIGFEGRVASVQLILGLPGEVDPPVSVWNGETTLGAAVRVYAPSVARRARVERVYRGAEDDPTANPRRPEWRDSSTSAVWRELAFERAASDAPGPVLAALPDGETVHWIEGAIPDGPFTAGSAVRVPLVVEPDLVGYRHKISRDMVGQVLVDEVAYSVANRGDAPLEVAIEEPLRGMVRPTVVFEKEAGELLRDRWRAQVTVPAHGIIQGQVVLQYRLKRY